MPTLDRATSEQIDEMLLCEAAGEQLHAHDHAMIIDSLGSRKRLEVERARCARVLRRMQAALPLDELEALEAEVEAEHAERVQLQAKADKAIRQIAAGLDTHGIRLSYAFEKPVQSERQQRCDAARKAREMLRSERLLPPGARERIAHLRAELQRRPQAVRVRELDSKRNTILALLDLFRAGLTESQSRPWRLRFRGYVAAERRAGREPLVDNLKQDEPDQVQVDLHELSKAVADLDAQLGKLTAQCAAARDDFEQALREACSRETMRYLRMVDQREIPTVIVAVDS